MGLSAAKNRISTYVLAKDTFLNRAKKNKLDYFQNKLFPIQGELWGRPCYIECWESWVLTTANAGQSRIYPKKSPVFEA